MGKHLENGCSKSCDICVRAQADHPYRKDFAGIAGGTLNSKTDESDL
jgi:hypothetical protein